jgi:hypothetical protein
MNLASELEPSCPMTLRSVVGGPLAEHVDASILNLTGGEIRTKDRARTCN